MQKILKFSFIFVALALSLTFVNPLKTAASVNQTSYVMINGIQALNVGDLSFSNISFKDYSLTSSQSFGLTGIVTNKFNNTITYNSSIYFYDLDYKLVAFGHNSNIASPGMSDFNQFLNLNVLGTHHLEEIKYYRLLININNDYKTFPPSKLAQFNYLDYVIDKYDVNIVVNENNTLDITETITAYFHQIKHGIIRTIPFKQTIKRADGTSSKVRMQITNVSVDNNYKLSREKNFYKIKIGLPYLNVIGEQKYTIHYTYNLGKDKINNYDELYYNIIGKDWDTVIGNITFKITMPKRFDSSKLGFSTGINQSENNGKVKYEIRDNTITGKYNGILVAGEALTIRCELEEGYFVGAKYIIDFKSIAKYFIPILNLIIAILIWWKFGKDKTVVETVEFYPPEDLNSLEVGYLYKGKVDNHDVISLLIYLANKGYLKISETEEKLTSTYYRKSFKITKLKEYDGHNNYEKIFFNGLFTQNIKNSKNRLNLFKNKKASKVTSEENQISDNEIICINSVTENDLNDYFYLIVDEIISKIKKNKEPNKFFEKKGSGMSIIIWILIIGTFCFITAPPVLTYENPFILIFLLILSITSFSIICITILDPSHKNKMQCIVTGSWTGIIWLSGLIPILLKDVTYLISYLIGLGCIFGMFACIRYLSKRTSYGNQMFGKIIGLKNFLEVAEKENLEAKVMKNPVYCYDLLPYAYVLGVSDKWIEKFETITMPPPSWYDEYSTFDLSTFRDIMNSNIDRISSNTSNNSSFGDSSSGSSSSGGGYSGGGYGGGGGSSW